MAQVISMPAGMKDTPTSTYEGFVILERPVHVWTTDGYYIAPRQIDTKKTSSKTTLPQIIAEARNKKPRQRPLTAGEWYMIREMLEQTEPGIEESMITAPYERTSTILDYIHGRGRRKYSKKGYYDGLLIQIPEADDEGNLIKDEKGILKARHIWEMALPIKSDYVKNMPPELDTFLNTIYGMDDARNKLPDYAHVSIKYDGLRNLVRGQSWHFQGDGRVVVNGRFGPLSTYWDVAARAATEGRTLHELVDADYRKVIELLEKTKNVSARDVEANMDGIKEILSRASIRQEEI